MTAPSLEDTIGAISNYTAGDTEGANIPSALLSTLSSLTASKLAQENPGYTDADLVLAQALLVLDRYERRPGDKNLSNEKMGNHAWAFNPNSAGTQWLDDYNALRAGYTEDMQLEGVERHDTDMDEMAADTWTVPSYSEADDPGL